MTYNGTWKVDHSENYEKFMEQMGKRLIAFGEFFWGERLLGTNGRNGFESKDKLAYKMYT